jgi:hypothetical protein
MVKRELRLCVHNYLHEWCISTVNTTLIPKKLRCAFHKAGLTVPRS